MTEEKIRVTFGQSTDENGEKFEFVEFLCPSCKSETITIPTTKKEPEILNYKCQNYSDLKVFHKRIIPPSQTE